MKKIENQIVKKALNPTEDGKWEKGTKRTDSTNRKIIRWQIKIQSYQ